MDEINGKNVEFNSLEERVIKIISATGISRMSELKEVDDMKELSYTELSNAVKHLAEIGILNRELLRLGASRGRNFYVFELSAKGKELAEILIGKEIVASQKEILLKEHKNLVIGYLFEDCSPILKEKGILLEKTDGSYSITINNKTYPIMLDITSNGNKVRTRDEYMEMFDKMLETSPIFYYLSTNYISSSFLILDEVEAWLKTRSFTRKDLENFQFHTSFMERILRGEGEHWNTLVDLWMDGLLRWSKMPPVFDIK